MKLKQSNSFYGIFMMAFVWIAYFCTMGLTFYGLSPITTEMVLTAGYTQKDVGFAVSVSTLVIGMGAPIATYIVKRWGVKHIFVLGAAFLCGCGLLLSFAPANPHIYIWGYGILAGLGMSFSGTYALGCVCNEWFTRYRGLAVTFIYTAGNVAGIVVPLILTKLVAVAGWRTGWTFMAACTALACVISVTMIVSRPSDLGQIPDGKAFSEEEGQPKKKYVPDVGDKKFPGGDIFRFRGTYVLAGSNALRNVYYFCFLGHAALYTIEKGFSPVFAATVISVLSLSNLIGRLATGIIFDRIFMPGFNMAFSCFTSFLSGLLMVIGHSEPLLIAAGIVLGFGNGVGTIASPSFTGTYFDKEYYPSVSGINSFSSYFFSAIGPALAGVIVTAMGSYNTAFIICAVVSLLAGMAILSFDRKILVSYK